MRIGGHLFTAVLAAIGGAVLTVLVGIPIAQSLDGISRKDVKHLNVQQAAEQIMPALAAHFVADAVDFRFDESISGGGAPSIEGVEFRMRAKASGWPGICVADFLGIEMETKAGAWSGAAERLEPSGAYQIRQGYRVIGDTTPSRAWGETDQAERDQRCRTIGAGPSFFTIGEGDQLRTLGDMLPALQEVADAATSSTLVRCEGNPQACRNPSLVIKSLHSGDLAFVTSVLDCEEHETCLEFSFAPAQRFASNSRQPPKVWIVRARGDYRGTHPNGWGKIALSSVELSYQ